MTVTRIFSVSKHATTSTLLNKTRRWAYHPTKYSSLNPSRKQILYEGDDDGIVPYDLYVNEIVDGVCGRLFVSELEVETGPDFGI